MQHQSRRHLHFGRVQHHRDWGYGRSVNVASRSVHLPDNSACGTWKERKGGWRCTYIAQRDVRCANTFICTYGGEGLGLKLKMLQIYILYIYIC